MRRLQNRHPGRATCERAGLGAGSLSMMKDRDDAERAILRLVSERGPEKSICPTEAAQAFGDAETWRSRLGVVRTTAAVLARAGRIEILRKGKPIDPDDMRGVIRLRIARGATAE